MADVHMLAQEHLTMVNALHYAPHQRDSATLQAAFDAVDIDDVAMIYLADVGDGIWTLDDDMVFPDNVILVIPPGVTVAGAGDLSGTSNILSGTQSWYVGTGTVSFSVPATFRGIQGLVARRIGVGVTSAPQAPLHVLLSGGANLRVEESTANGSAAVEFLSAGTRRGLIGLAGNQNITIAMENSAKLNITGGNVGINVTNPTNQLQLSADTAFKAATNTWQTPCDARLKEVQGDYEDGSDLAVLDDLNPVRFKYNGKAGTLDNDEEYVGFLAQDLQTIFPYMVRTYQGFLEEDDTEETTLYTYDGGAFTFFLLNVCKALRARLETAETALETAETALTTAQGNITSLQTALAALTDRVEALESA